MRKINFKKAIAGISAISLLCASGVISPNMADDIFTNSINASAASISQETINENDMFFTQDRSNNCTHASIAMLLRRVSRINGGDYKSITQNTTRSTVWSDVGAKHNFTYSGMSISYCNKNDVYNQLSKYNGSRKELFKALLEQHPEGIVVYDSWHLSGEGDKPSLWYPQAKPQVSDAYNSDHAILLTDYDKATDTFYAADPAKNPAKRIKLSLTTRPHIDYFDTYWYYTSELKNKITTTNEVSSTPTGSIYRVYDTNNIRIGSFTVKDNAYNMLKKNSSAKYMTKDNVTLTGDLDLSGAVDMTDLSYLSLYNLGDTTFEKIAIDIGIANPEVVKFNADVTGDGKVDLCDLATLRRIISKQQ